MSIREPKVIDKFIDWLLSLGYDRDQIQVQYKIPSMPGGIRRTNPVDIAVFKDKNKLDENLLFIVECKRSSYDGMDQLRRYLRCAGIHFGIWFNGVDIAYVVDMPSVFENSDVGKLTFGEFLKQHRNRLKQTEPEKYSTRQVAQRVGVSPGYISQLETGTTPPPGDKVMLALAQDLQVNPDVLFALDGRISPEMKARIALRPHLMIPLIYSLENMSDDHIRRLIEHVRDMKIKDGDW